MHPGLRLWKRNGSGDTVIDFIRRQHPMAMLIPATLVLLVLFFIIPMGAGVGLTLLSAWGWDFFQPSPERLEAFFLTFTHPQFLPSLSLTLRTGILSSLLSLGLVFLIAGGWSIRPGRLARIIPVWLAYPHVAFSIGLVFLISPSGFLVRWMGAPFGIDTPLDWGTYQDPFGFSLILGLSFKETVFLLFIAFSQLSQINTHDQYKTAASLGYSPAATWLKVIWPQVYRGIRFPFFIVLSYSFSTVDMGLILAGKTPPPFAVLILQWFQDPDLSYTRLSSAAAFVLIILFALSVGGWLVLEKIMATWMRRLIFLGSRKSLLPIGPRISNGVFGFLSIGFLLSLIINGIWSVTRNWSFPALFPIDYTGQAWNFLDHPRLVEIMTSTISLASTSAIVGLAVAVIVLEMSHSIHFPSWNPLRYYLTRFLIFMPLLLPSVSLYIGIRIFFLITAPPLSAWSATLLGHFLIVFPYILLTLEKPYLSFNQQYFIAARSLSRSNLRAFFQIKFPMLKKPLLASFAIGLSVSIMDYLATTILSGGRLSTVTTEAVQLSDGGNLRIMGFFAILQTLLVTVGFLSCQNFSLARSMK